MAKVQLKESTMLEKMVEMLLTEHNFDVSEMGCALAIEGCIKGLASVLSFNKSKEHPVAVTIEKQTQVQDEHEVIFAIIAEFKQDEEDEEKSNWQIVMTLDGSDIPSNAKIISLQQEPLVGTTIAAECNKINTRFHDRFSMIEIMAMFPLALRAWLDANAKEGETVTLESDFFNASVSIEDNVKYFAVTPGADIKKIIAKTEND